METARWISCPHYVGEFETGCHTAEANNLVLYLNTTKILNEGLRRLYGRMFIHFSRGKYKIWDKEGFPDSMRYAFTECGVYSLNEISWYVDRRLKILMKFYKELYKEEVKEDLMLSESSITDFKYWLLRDFQIWLNNNKRYHQT